MYQATCFLISRIPVYSPLYSTCIRACRRIISTISSVEGLGRNSFVLIQWLIDQSYVQTPEVPGGEESTDSSRGDGKQSESHENLPKRSIAQNAPTASPTPTVPEKPKEDSRRQKKRTVLKKEKFLRQIQVRNGEMFVQISFESSQDWYLYSFQVNGREIYYHWEDSWCTGEEIPWQGGENRIDATVRTGDGKIYDMEPWIVLRQMDNI